MWVRENSWVRENTTRDLGKHEKVRYGRTCYIGSGRRVELTGIKGNCTYREG